MQVQRIVKIPYYIRHGFEVSHNGQHAKEKRVDWKISRVKKALKENEFFDSPGFRDSPNMVSLEWFAARGCDITTFGSNVIQIVWDVEKMAGKSSYMLIFVFRIMNGNITPENWQTFVESMDKALLSSESFDMKLTPGTWNNDEKTYEFSRTKDPLMLTVLEYTNVLTEDVNSVYDGCAVGKIRTNKGKCATLASKKGRKAVYDQQTGNLGLYGQNMMFATQPMFVNYHQQLMEATTELQNAQTADAKTNASKKIRDIKLRIHNAKKGRTSKRGSKKRRKSSSNL